MTVLIMFSWVNCILVQEIRSLFVHPAAKRFVCCESMASTELEAPLLSFHGDLFPRAFSVGIEEVYSAEADVLPALEASKPVASSNKSIPKPPPLPSVTYKRCKHSQNLSNLLSSVTKEKIETWDKLFKEGFGADVYVFTEDGARVPAHSSVLAAASPVLENLINQSRAKNGMRYVKIPCVPYEAVYAFIRFLYSSCYEEEDAKKFVLHLLVLSHCYSIPSLKRTCVHILEQGWLNDENVIDVLQLAQRCDVPRIYFICVSMVIKNFKSVSSTEGWKVMRRTNPSLEQELVGAVIEADTRKQERAQKLEERTMYLQLYEAMEALLHICRDGCRTIGPRDKALKGIHVTCKFPACKGLEALVRHFSGCKTRVPGGCSHCRRMWQLFELHSRICRDPDSCKVPLCRHLKEKMKQHIKKDEAKWRVLVTNVLAAKNTLGPFSSRLSGLL